MADHSGVENLSADKNQDNSKGVFHIFESLDHRRHGKIHAAQPEDSKDIAGINHEWLIGDGENSRNTVQCKQNIHKFDTDQRHKKRSGVIHHFARRMIRRMVRQAGEEIMPVNFLGKTQMFLKEPDQFTVLDFIIIILHQQHFDTGDQQERREDIQGPTKGLDNNNPCRNHDAAHHQNTQNAPEQNAVLVFSRNMEIGQNNRHDEQIIQRQRQLDHIGSEIIHAIIRPLFHP